MTTRSFGYRKDPEDARDRPLRALLGDASAFQLPLAASVEDSRVGPKDQSHTGSCTGQAWAQALRLAYLHAGRDCPELSALFSYFCNRAEFGAQGEDEGAYLRTGAAAAMKLGCATEAAWPFADARVNLEPGWSAFRSAHDRRGVRGYHRVPANANDVRRAIAAGLPVVGGWEVDTAFMDFDGIGIITKANPNDILGGHALPVVSYAADGTFRVLNSWGYGWGDAGYGKVDEAFIESGSDLWVVDVGGAP